MKTIDRDNARQLLYEIDALSESAILVNDTLECLKENGGKAKLSVYTSGKNIVTELDKDTAIIVMREIIGMNNDAIRVRKANLEVVLRNALVTLN